MNEKYIIKVWFEHGGVCLWGMNQAAKEKYNYPIAPELLPISEETKAIANSMNKAYRTAYDWNDFSKGTVWTEEQIEEFEKKSQDLAIRLQKELGDDYIIKYEATF